MTYISEANKDIWIIEMYSAIQINQYVLKEENICLKVFDTIFANVPDDVKFFLV